MVDKVRVRSDLKVGGYYNFYEFTENMKWLKSNIVTIQSVLTNRYHIKEDNGRFGWTDDMFEEEMEDKKMDNKNITINMENLSEEERDTLLSLVEKANKPVNKVWKPEYDSDYYFIRNNGQICHTNFIKSDTDKERFILGNCFKTEEEAEFALERQKVITELKRFAIEHNDGEIDWNSKIQNIYCLYYREHRGDIEADYFCSRLWDGVFFTSKKTAEQAIEAIGEERIKKYYFEVNG